MNVPRIVDLVDSVEYTYANCFTHQLYKRLQATSSVTTVALANVQDISRGHKPDLILSRLKQRTLYRVARDIAKYVGDIPVVVYDQDPWHNFEDASPYKGTYDITSKYLNIKSFAVTSKWWSDFILSRGLPSTFVRMWVLPEYCDRGTRFELRDKRVGFIGGLHPHREALIKRVRAAGVDVYTAGNSLGYRAFLAALSSIGIFIHNEDQPVIVDGETLNIGTGMWVKDIEAAARGCYSIRNRAEGHETYLEGIHTVRLYDDASEVQDIIGDIIALDADERWWAMNDAVERIKAEDVWSETVKTLVTL